MNNWHILSAPFTWVLSKKVLQQSRAGPGEHVSKAHAVWNVLAEALSDVLLKEISIGVSLAVCHQQQHPHKTNVDCNKHIRAFKWNPWVRSMSDLFCRTFTQIYCYPLKNSFRKAKALSSRILFFLIFSMSAGAGGWYTPLLGLTICGSLCPPAGNSSLKRSIQN